MVDLLFSENCKEKAELTWQERNSDEMTHTRFRQLMKNKMAESLDFIGGSAVFVWLK